MPTPFMQSAVRLAVGEQSRARVRQLAAGAARKRVLKRLAVAGGALTLALAAYLVAGCSSVEYAADDGAVLQADLGDPCIVPCPRDGSREIICVDPAACYFDVCGDAADVQRCR